MALGRRAETPTTRLIPNLLARMVIEHRNQVWPPVGPGLIADTWPTEKLAQPTHLATTNNSSTSWRHGMRP
ncbi:hypothetical protein Sinac_4292 [Singulisphaera acidiphila DSM 18658]|uniref:Uncharacterized protein n=1 Tax=Singulisphaera acidiphila (strain ATCC BAA-1392 / DSM 18658 / VKM B-2454 / MOB10) TaxID=886293 RepID=L0DIM0_SINAD|nr:hypothetical protein Sinac_4292 [Singulisphaera acidiphila DSM 18658]